MSLQKKAILIRSFLLNLNSFCFVSALLNNHCSIYDARPKACAEYPHTNRKHFVQILDLTLKNTFVCPAAYEVVEILKKN